MRTSSALEFCGKRKAGDEISLLLAEQIAIALRQPVQRLLEVVQIVEAVRRKNGGLGCGHGDAHKMLGEKTAGCRP
jgi:hypothetical protein